MVVAIAPWSIVLTPGNVEVIIPQGDLQIKNAALPDELQDNSARTSVKLTYQSLASLDEEDDDEDDEDDEPKIAAVTTVLCSLTPGKIEQSTCEIILEQDTEYILEVVGKNSIHLYGNYIDQVPVDQPPFGSDTDSDEEDEDDEEEAYNLGEVSSDVEIEVDADETALDVEDDDAARFEEIHDEESPKTLKRPRDDDMEAEEHDEKLSKSQRKKMAKKLKAVDGKAVPVSTPEKKVAEKKVEEKEEDEKKKKKKEKKDKTEKKEKAEQKDGEKKEKGDKTAERTLEGGVKVRDFKVGTGKMVKKGDKVGMRYIGKFLDGKVFDKNTKGKAFFFKLGQGDVIKGWDVGVAGMQIGGEREIVVPPSMGYGNRKMDGIPSGSTLKFEVKLLEIK
ncbi:hypothetical protein L210DRAFT_3447334 [Boletus edulis BED1]|uniref:FK506-binding protein n=1 Tax=Boletus edulis BED1 TaxID=1328754 RepID=A0AAD4BWW4_BOLED|nr:hypothetical protein L210DRAFT_3447334 [Boletus edulis BED1]